MLSRVKYDNPPLAAIFSVEGTELTEDEKKLFKEANPLGFILFKRNCEDPEQVKKLVKELHKCMGRKVPVLIDQEGGRVQRMKEPNWKNYPAAASFEDDYKKDAGKGGKKLRKAMKGLAKDLNKSGINVNCAPVLDVHYPKTHKAIGDRAYSDDPKTVGELSTIVCEAFLDRKIMPVIKHIPGQGRAESDSHVDLPVVKATLDEMRKTDFVPYKDLLSKDFAYAVWGMVAHIIYEDIDPKNPSSCSEAVIKDIIRKELGFDGLLLSDDIDMDALSVYGDAAGRAEKVLEAGCDIALHCNGKLDEMQDIAKRIPKMTTGAVIRYNRSVIWMKRNIT